MRLARSQVPRLYALADAEAYSGRALADVIDQLAAAGVAWIQVRWKRGSDREVSSTIARASGRIGEGARLWVNDRVHVAVTTGIPRVHLGQTDLPPSAARRVLGGEAWIGLSTHDLEQAEVAAADPEVDLIAVGPVFGTRSKRAAEPAVGLELVRAVRALGDKPLVAIGGIDGDNAPSVLDAGADGVAVISALAAAGDPGSAAAVLLDRLNS